MSCVAGCLLLRLFLPFAFGLQLYRECLRRAKYVGSRQHNTELVVDMVRQQFRKHVHETNPDKIQKLKDDAARGLINHILYESEKMSGRKFSQNS